jgi:hypothetical protein
LIVSKIIISALDLFDPSILWALARYVY